jgi:hypothetical protein
VSPSAGDHPLDVVVEVLAPGMYEHRKLASGVAGGEELVGTGGRKRR